jgi:peptidyl-tRNA hydrolase
MERVRGARARSLKNNSLASTQPVRSPRLHLSLHPQGRGKTAAQACHACLGLYKKLRHRKEPIVKVWEAAGATKVCLRAESEAELMALQKAAAAAGVPTHMVVDAGRTQVAPDSRTVLALLAAGGEVDAVTGGLKLL